MFDFILALALILKHGRIRKWKKVEGENKYLRVILLPDGETVHNVFFDRDFKGDKK